MVFPPPTAGDLEGDVQLDEETWTVEGLESVALHEIGHSLGLDHHYSAFFSL
jgi:predicted Zn-dependent protease